MPCELRYLEFSLDEIRNILVVYGPEVEIEVPDQPLVNVYDNATAPDAVMFEFEGQNRAHIISNSRLISCILAYCSGNGIPMPRKGVKSVMVSFDFLLLRVELGHPGCKCSDMGQRIPARAQAVAAAE